MKLLLALNVDELHALRALVCREAERLRQRAPDMFPYGSGHYYDRATAALARRIERMADAHWRRYMAARRKQTAAARKARRKK